MRTRVAIRLALILGSLILLLWLAGVLLLTFQVAAGTTRTYTGKRLHSMRSSIQRLVLSWPPAVPRTRSAGSFSLLVWPAHCSCSVVSTLPLRWSSDPDASLMVRRPRGSRTCCSQPLSLSCSSYSCYFLLGACSHRGGASLPGWGYADSRWASRILR